MFKTQGKKSISTSLFLKTQQLATVWDWHQILCIYLYFQHENSIPIIIKFYKKIRTYQYLFNNKDIMMSDLTHYRVLITLKVYTCLKLKPVLEILHHLLCPKALKGTSITASWKKISDFSQLCLTFGLIPKLIIVKSYDIGTALNLSYILCCL